VDTHTDKPARESEWRSPREVRRIPGNLRAIGEPSRAKLWAVLRSGNALPIGGTLTGLIIGILAWRSSETLC